MTAWGVTKTKTRFKAAIVGAGATNWESMVLESAAPELEVRLSDANGRLFQLSLGSNRTKYTLE